MDLRQSIRDQTDVSLSLAQLVALKEAKGSNLVFSPLSIHVLLSLVTAGSSGPTLHQSLSFLRSKSLDDLRSLSSQIVALIFSDGSQIGGPKLSFASGVWLDQSLSLKSYFKQAAEVDYKAALKQVDFINRAAEVTGEVNSWAEAVTGGLISEVLPPGSVDHMTRLILANAIYFKGAWDAKFDLSETQHHDFHIPGKIPIQAPFMSSKKKQFITTFDGFKVLGLPYKQGNDKRRFSMYIFLPEARDGLPPLIGKMGSQPNFLDHHCPSRKVVVGEFRVPKFKFSFGFQASEVLKGLGLSLPFAGGGLTEMVDSSLGGNLSVSDIFHKAAIEVNEEGTEAAAASVAPVLLRSLDPPETVDFVADHPFLFFIREDVTGVALFMGQVINPLEG